jgi:RimJ/RimL family protein N-acetyltransferase
MPDSPAPTTDDARAALAAADGPPALRFPYDATALTEHPLRTERLVLRPLEPSDAADVYEYQRIPEVLRYLPWPERDRTEGYAHTAQRAAARLLAVEGDFVVLAAVLPGTRSVDDPRRDRVIGDFMVRVSSSKHAQLELGWVLHPDFQGLGYAREGARAVRDFVFETLNPHRVQAFLDARNGASAALCERLGMRREATILEEQYNDGEWQDTAVYGVLRREWAAARGPAITRP